MRDDKFLEERLNAMWEMLFPEVPKANEVIIRFKGRWKNKFGHIKRIKDKSEIVINGLFKHEEVPEYIIDLTIGHELIHYMHGFNSPLKRQYKHPHKGGIVDKELIKRGFGHLLRKEKIFVKKEWKGIYGGLAGSKEKKIIKKRNLFDFIRFK